MKVHMTWRRKTGGFCPTLLWRSLILASRSWAPCECMKKIHAHKKHRTIVVDTPQRELIPGQAYIPPGPRWSPFVFEMVVDLYGVRYLCALFPLIYVRSVCLLNFFCHRAFINKLQPRASQGPTRCEARWLALGCCSTPACTHPLVPLAGCEWAVSSTFTWSVPSPFPLIFSSAFLVWLQAFSKLPLGCPPEAYIGT
jgi:hypothetical protein